MDAATYWTAVGSVGTAVGSLIALTAIAVTVVLARRQRQDEQAARLREDLRAVVGQAGALTRTLRDGSPIIGAAWQARHAVQEVLPAPADHRALQALLKEQGVGLSVAVASWERSPEAEVLRTQVTALTEASRRLTGHLNVLSNAGELLVAIADDARMTFLRLLTDDTLLAMFIAKHRHLTDTGSLLNALATHLHGNTALYFTARYQAALDALDTLVTALAMALSELDAAALAAAAQAKSPVTTDTRTGEMRRHLAALSAAGLLPTPTVQRLDALVLQVESAIDREAAQARLSAQAQARAH
jgi:hypothetical protein